jgi:hypothetical protein
MADIFTILITNLNELGFYNFVLPFLFVFAVVYGLLAKAGMFGGANTRISALLGLIVAFFAVGYYGPPMAGFFSSLFGSATIFLAAILVIVLFLAMAGFRTPDILTAVVGRGGSIVAILILVVVGIILFMTATGTVITGIALEEGAIAAIFVVVVIIIAMLFVVGEKKEAKPAPTPKEQGG